MESIKKKSKIISKISKVFILLLFISCNGQDKNTQNMNIDKFDIVELESFIEKGGNIDALNPYILITNKNDTIHRKSRLISADKGSIRYQEDIIPPLPSLFYIVKTYDESGNKIEEISNVFFGNLNFNYGTHTYFRKNGEIDKKIDFENDFKKYKIKLTDLMKIISLTEINITEIDHETAKNIQLRLVPNFDFKQKNYQNIIRKIDQIYTLQELSGKFEKNILNPQNRYDIERISIEKNDDKTLWIVTKDYSSLGRIEFIIDGQSGKMIKSIYKLD